MRMEPSAVRSPVEEFAGFVGDLGDLERGVEAEVDHIEAGGRGEGDGGSGGDVVGGGVELGVDDVAGDVERWALALRNGGLGGEGRADERQKQERSRAEKAAR